ncbi:signal peptidase I [Candidatus Gottesmanbacteria bacterium]|nr:signal peptidase I [Candidatus Gottesmanbacteria bacterium]
MSKQSSPRVAIDSEIAEVIPTVVVSKPPPPEAPENDSQESDNFIVRAIKKLISLFLDFLETIVVALSIFVVVYLFIFQPHEIKGSSMEPNFFNNEYILTDKISYRFGEPKRGDVIILKAPKNPDIDYIKRVIGLPNERLKVQNGFVYINGEQLLEPYISETTNLFPGSYMQEGVEITVPEGFYFVMGDNRQHSSDSREFGPISSDLIIGRAFLRYWPPKQFGPLEAVRYSL